MAPPWSERRFIRIDGLHIQVSDYSCPQRRTETLAFLELMLAILEWKYAINVCSCQAFGLDRTYSSSLHGSSVVCQLTLQVSGLFNLYKHMKKFLIMSLFIPISSSLIPCIIISISTFIAIAVAILWISFLWQTLIQIPRASMHYPVILHPA